MKVVILVLIALILPSLSHAQVVYDYPYYGELESCRDAYDKHGFIDTFCDSPYQQEIVDRVGSNILDIEDADYGHAAE